MTTPVCSRVFVSALLIAVLAMTNLINTGYAASSDIEIIHEAVLEEGKAVEPLSITRTPDNSYIVTGVFAREYGVAIKTDAVGNVQWRYSATSEADPKLDVISAPHFTGAMSLSDGTTLLCGYRQSDDSSGPHPHRKGRFSGLLVRLDRQGKLIEQKDLFPGGNDASSLNFISKCAPWNDGYLLLGTTRAQGYWIIALDRNGLPKWEKIVPSVPRDLNPVMRPIALKNGNMVLTLWPKGKAFNSLIVSMDVNGEFVAQKEYVQTLAPVLPLQQGFLLRFLGSSSGRESGIVIMLDENLNEQEAKPVVANFREAGGAAYQLLNGSFALFDSHRERGTATASVKRVSSDAGEIDEMVFEPRFGSFWVADAAVGIGKDEFVAVRNLVDRKAGLGMGLTLLRIK